MHSSIIYSIPGFPLIGNNSFGLTLVKGSNLVPSPASGIIAFARRNVSSVRRDISRILSVVSLPPNNISTVDYGIQMQKWTPFRIAIKTPILFVTEAGPVKHDHQKKWCLLLGRKLEFIHLEGNHFGLREEIIAHEVATKIITRVSI